MQYPLSAPGNGFTLGIVLLTIVFLVGVTVAKAEQRTQDPRPLAFAHIAIAASAMETVSSDFTQERFASMLKDPLVSSGRFAYEKPDRLYWEVVKPSASGFVVKGGKARRWDGDSHDRTEAFDLEKEPVMRAIVEQVFAWVRGDFPWLEKRYKITTKEGMPTVLKLLPLLSQEKKYVAYLNITFSKDWAYVSSVEIHEKSGDYTRISFLNTAINEPLPKGLFAP